ncbi:MAG: transaldolase family protein [Armatimonadetes bacterium]|nr:transaldolase family protein [Armatimonadota bacterium]
MIETTNPTVETAGSEKAQEVYLRWLVTHTPTKWWHDSADPDELRKGLAHGAVGVTTNPVLTYQALSARTEYWRTIIGPVPADLDGDGRAEELIKGVVQHTARTLEPKYAPAGGPDGHVCAQVNPAKCADVQCMLDMARRFHAWAPNIAVKLPVTAAGLDALEECAAEGITVTATVSFTVPQVVAVAERYRRGLERAKAEGIAPGHCFSVIMIGRLDDYLRDVAMDRNASVRESDVKQAGLAATKRAYQIYKERSYEAILLIAALRGSYHMTELAGGELIMSIHPKVQAVLHQPDVPRETRIDRPVQSDVISRLQTLPEFVRAYEPDGMAAEEFITYGVTQRTLTQFSESGWQKLASFRL